MTFHPRQLAASLARPLPGRAGWRPFEPELSFGRHVGPAPASARSAAVMLLLYPDDAGQWRLPLTLRPAHLLHHSNQISLPGGLVEPGETLEVAALRELEEELACPADSVEILGHLSELYLFVSNYRVSPIVGWTPVRPAFVPSPAEVDELVELPLARINDPAAAVRIQRHQGPLDYTVPAIHFDGHDIWGATSMIVGELAAVVAAM